MVTRWPAVLQCWPVCCCVAPPAANLELGWLQWRVDTGPGSRLQTEEGRGEGAISWEPPHHRHQPRSFEWSQGPAQHYVNSDFRLHCLQPGDLQQHEEWSQACAEERELHPATSFLWPGGREPGVSCAAPGRWTAATIKLVIWRQLVRYWHCFLSSWAVNYGTSQNFSARRWPLLGTTPCWKCLIPVLCFHSLQ